MEPRSSAETFVCIIASMRWQRLRTPGFPQNTSGSMREERKKDGERRSESGRKMKAREEKRQIEIERNKIPQNNQLSSFFFILWCVSRRTQIKFSQALRIPHPCCYCIPAPKTKQNQKKRVKNESIQNHPQT